MVNTRSNQCNNQANNTNNGNPPLEQLIAMQTKLIQTMQQTLNHMQQNQNAHQQPPLPPPQSRLVDFLRI
jgi:hypothetical protein